VEKCVNLYGFNKVYKLRKLYVAWIIMAWQNMSPEVTVKGFKKCCISNAVDETDDDMLWKDSEVRQEG
jgi:hypothetical protein